MESPKLKDHITTLAGSGNFPVEKVSCSDETVWVDKAKARGFRGVPEEVWNFHIAGYQVCEKWLKDRQAKGGKNPRPGRVCQSPFRHSDNPSPRDLWTSSCHNNAFPAISCRSFGW